MTNRYRVNNVFVKISQLGIDKTELVVLAVREEPARAHYLGTFTHYCYWIDTKNKILFRKKLDI